MRGVLWGVACTGNVAITSYNLWIVGRVVLFTYRVGTAGFLLDGPMTRAGALDSRQQPCRA